MYALNPSTSKCAIMVLGWQGWGCLSFLPSFWFWRRQCHWLVIVVLELVKIFYNKGTLHKFEYGELKVLSQSNQLWRVAFHAYLRYSLKTPFIFKFVIFRKNSDFWKIFSFLNNFRFFKNLWIFVNFRYFFKFQFF